MAVAASHGRIWLLATQSSQLKTNKNDKFIDEGGTAVHVALRLVDLSFILWVFRCVSLVDYVEMLENNSK